jgi:NitT/TauT family transport system permease protein/taurine transport system permease protein
MSGVMDSGPVSGAAYEGLPVEREEILLLRRARRIRFAVRTFQAVVPFVVLAAVWQAAVRLGEYPVYLFPPPATVWHAAREILGSGELWTHTIESMGRVLLGSTAAIAVAFPLGLAMGMNRTASNYFTPMVTFFQAVPGLAWTPLAILWFGIGYKTVTFIVFLSVFFPVLFNTVVGIRSVNQTLINAVLTLGAPRLYVILEVLLPGALAYIVTGIRLGLGYGWRALVAVEMIGATSGLGFMIFDARAQLRSDLVIVGMLALGSVWLIADSLLLKPLEARTIERWGLLR